MHVWAQVAAESKRGHQISWSRSYNLFWVVCLSSVLGTKLWSSGRLQVVLIADHLPRPFSVGFSNTDQPQHHCTWVRYVVPLSAELKAIDCQPHEWGYHSPKFSLHLSSMWPICMRPREVQQKHIFAESCSDCLLVCSGICNKWLVFQITCHCGLHADKSNWPIELIVWGKCSFEWKGVDENLSA